MHVTGDSHGTGQIGLLTGGLVSGSDESWLRQGMDRLLPMAAPRVSRFTLRLVDDAEMALLHKRHMNDPTTTDVLTFVDGHEVDVAVCVDEARRRSAELGHEVRRELLLYALHGMLHAAGMDDRTPDDFARMHAEEDRLLVAAGLQPTFEPGQGSA
ncbi:MAG: rRNA maturation RNase YbeY [Planctomycetes bacterium]|nr:rRNA maturation RNase YbeY [Planctomycetota bacterium]